MVKLVLDMGEIQKQRVGRPTKYRSEFIEEAEQFCRDKGYTNEQLAATFKISTKPLYDWKNKYSEFREAINRGKEDFEPELSRTVLSSVLQVMSTTKS